MKVKELLAILAEHKERDNILISVEDDNNLYELEDGISIFLPEEATERNIYLHKNIGSVVLTVKPAANGNG